MSKFSEQELANLIFDNRAELLTVKGFSKLINGDSVELNLTALTAIVNVALSNVHSETSELREEIGKYEVRLKVLAADCEAEIAELKSELADTKEDLDTIRHTNHVDELEREINRLQAALAERKLKTQPYGWVVKMRDGHETYFRKEPTAFHSESWRNLVEVIALYEGTKEANEDAEWRPSQRQSNNLRLFSKFQEQQPK